MHPVQSFVNIQLLAALGTDECMVIIKSYSGRKLYSWDWIYARYEIPWKVLRVICEQSSYNVNGYYSTLDRK